MTEGSRLRTLFVGSLLAAVLATGVVGVGACGQGDAVSQPVAFDHALHVGQVQLECISCHGDAWTSPHAGLPEVDFCGQCHPGPSDRPGLAELAGYIERGEQVPFVQLNRYAGHVYFSHRMHVALAEMACTECHADVAQMTQPHDRADASLQSMDDCMACHVQRGATLECLACHK